MGEQDSDQATEAREQANEPGDQDNGSSGDTPTEKPEPDQEDREKAKEMMGAYEERPTLILPGTGGAVSGTAVGEWLDDDGNPKYGNDEDAPAAKAKADGDDGDDGESDGPSYEEQVEKDKEFNAAVIKASKERLGDEDKDGKAEAPEDDKAVSK